MARERDPHDTDRDHYEPHPRRRTRTPVGGIDIDPVHALRAEIRDEVAELRSSIRALEELAVVLRGVPGHPGALEDLRTRIGAMKAHIERLEADLEAQGKVVAALDRVHWKILVAASVSGGIVALVVSIAKALT